MKGPLSFFFGGGGGGACSFLRFFSFQTYDSVNIPIFFLYSPILLRTPAEGSGMSRVEGNERAVLSAIELVRDLLSEIPPRFLNFPRLFFSAL